MQNKPGPQEAAGLPPGVHAPLIPTAPVAVQNELSELVLAAHSMPGQPVFAMTPHAD
jgi:hypothetical protein